MSSSLAMTRAEREAFLAATRVGMVSIAEPGRGPLTVPVWYRYEPGGTLCFGTGAQSRKARLIRAAGRIGFCVQTETAPYQYVSVEGPVTLGEVDPERDTREMAIRYLGQQMGEMYLAMLAAEADPTASVLVILKPERWYSVDYTKMGATA
jgi:nitroimidazol reductase NimA-like FMN-containing flavoprotein (pyridoxamine 5'-phosphate oxidase superfamily)